MVRSATRLIGILIFSSFAPSLKAIDTSGLIDAKKYDFSFKIDIDLAKKNIETGERIYEEGRCILRAEVAKALSRVQAQLKLQSFELLIKDCYRPLSIQKRFADKLKDSLHSRGGAVDLVLIDKMGAHAGPQHQRLLEKAMKVESFIRSKTELNHYEYKSNLPTPELDIPLKEIP